MSQTDAHRGTASPCPPARHQGSCAPNRLSRFPIGGRTRCADAVRLIAEQRLPGLLVTDAAGRAVADILPAPRWSVCCCRPTSRTIRSLAGVLRRSPLIMSPTNCAKTVERSDRRPGTCTINADDTIVEVAAPWRASDRHWSRWCPAMISRRDHRIAASGSGAESDEPPGARYSDGPSSRCSFRHRLPTDRHRTGQQGQ